MGLVAWAGPLGGLRAGLVASLAAPHGSCLGADLPAVAWLADGFLTGRATGLAYATVLRVDWRREVLEGTRGDADMVLRDGRVCLFVDRDA